MIKGINRQVVEVRETGNECFERILFFVKPEYAGMSEGKIRERADMVTKTATAPPPARAYKGRLNGYIKSAALVLAGLTAGFIIGFMFR